MRESYFKQLYEFEIQNEKIKWIKGLINQGKRIAMANDEKQARIAKKRAELENRANPYSKEIDTCEHLINYCNTVKRQQGLMAPTNEEVAKKTENELINEYNRQDIEQKLKDGKIQAVVKKDEIMQIGGGKKNKGKKQKTDTVKSQSFNIDFSVISKFGLVQVSPPISAEELDPKIEELVQKQKKFLAEGEAILAKEKTEIEAQIESLVDEDIAAEAKAAEQEEYGEEEEEKERHDDARAHTHRGRGGFAKTYGGREDFKKKTQPKDEYFDGSDSDEEIAQAYSKPSRGGGM